MMDHLEVEEVFVKRKKDENLAGGAKRLKSNIHGEVSASLATRTLPRHFVKHVINNLSTSQRNSIKEIGFGCFEHLNMEAIPLQLGYWLADSFDAHKRCIRMATDGDKISVEDKDVYIALGLPMGHLEVRPAAEGEDCEALKMWKQYVSPGKECIFQKQVYAKLADGDGGIFFKQSFVVLVISMLIESTTSGALNLEYFKMLEDVDRIKDYNWCQLLIERLVLAKVTWDKNRSGWFKGSVLFLMLLYVDRVEHLKNYNVPRNIPTFINWTGAALMKREKLELTGVGFGHGIVLDRQEIRESSNHGHANLAFKEIYMHEMSTLSTSVAKIVRLTAEGLETMGGDEEFHTMVAAMKRLIGEASSVGTEHHMIVASDDVGIEATLPGTSKLKKLKEPVSSDSVGLIEDVCRGLSVWGKDVQGANVIDLTDSPPIPAVPLQTIHPSKALPAQSLNQLAMNRRKLKFGTTPSMVVNTTPWSSRSGILNNNQQKRLSTQKDYLQHTPDQHPRTTHKVEVLSQGQEGLDKAFLPLRRSSPRNTTIPIFSPVTERRSNHKHDLQQTKTHTPSPPVTGKSGQSGAVKFDLPMRRTSPRSTTPRVLQYTTTPKSIPASRESPPVTGQIGQSGAVKFDLPMRHTPPRSTTPRVLQYTTTPKSIPASRESPVKCVHSGVSSMVGPSRRISPRTNSHKFYKLTDKGRAFMITKNTTFQQGLEAIGGKLDKDSHKEKRIQPKRNVGPIQALRSPFVDRFIDPCAKRTLELTTTFKFCSEGNLRLVIFRCGLFNLQRSHLRSLQYLTPIVPNVVDAWSRVLIANERLRSNSSPYRFFGTCNLACYEGLLPATWRNSAHYRYFEDGMTSLLQETSPPTPLADVDMVIFPVLQSAKFYVVCFHFGAKKVHIIDHTNNGSSETTQYGNVPTNLRDFFAHYLLSTNLAAKAKSIINVAPSVVDIKWNNPNNSVDSGIYCMRHMETFMGVQG